MRPSIHAAAISFHVLNCALLWSYGISREGKGRAGWLFWPLGALFTPLLQFLASYRLSTFFHHHHRYHPSAFLPLPSPLPRFSSPSLGQRLVPQLSFFFSFFPFPSLGGHRCFFSVIQRRCQTWFGDQCRQHDYSQINVLFLGGLYDRMN